jgi:penicillin-binding protein 2
METIKTPDGRILYQSEPEVIGKVPVSKPTLGLIKTGLWAVVNSDSGTARGSRLADIEISGKTGTSQVISRKKDDTQPEEERPAHLRPHAWFVAYAPSENPVIAVAVLIEHGEHGSSAAAPVARELIKTFLRKPVTADAVAGGGGHEDNRGG